jgi:hypothetical protein
LVVGTITQDLCKYLLSMLLAKNSASSEKFKWRNAIDGVRLSFN